MKQQKNLRKLLGGPKEWFRTVVGILGFLLALYGWFSTFVSVPVVQDWRWSLFVGLILYSGSLLWKMSDLKREKLDLHQQLLGENPKVNLVAKVEAERSGNVDIKHATLLIENDDGAEITDCYATLKVENLYGEDQLEIPVINNERIKWWKSTPSNDNCQAHVPPRSSIEKLWVASSLSPYFIHLCHPGLKHLTLSGLNVIHVRLDGKIRGKDITPKEFDGYLYIVHTDYMQTTFIFEEGNWMNDERIPERYRIHINKQQLK